MKKIVAGLALMMVMSISVNAQDVKEQKKRSHKGTHDRTAFYQELELTDAQKTEMQKVQADYRSKTTELRKNENITVKEMKERRSALAKEHRAAVENILTPDQKTKMRELRKSGTSRKGKRGGKHVDFTAKLNLSDSQAEKMKSVNEGFKTKVKDIHSNSALDKEAKKQQVMSLRKQHQEEVRSILTPEQLEKMKELRQSRTGKVRTR